MNEKEIARKFTSESESETMDFAHRFATSLKKGCVVALQGELGSGKTHFVKGMAQAFGIDQSMVHSPTYSLIHEYDGRLPLYHFDCYRMESVREALEIGAEEYFYRQGVCVIEWPERISAILPEETIWIKLEISGQHQRQIFIKKKGG
jgi:tRNA threonylcarbamoyladenosine biosynthesis protein TsaE